MMKWMMCRYQNEGHNEMQILEILKSFVWWYWSNLALYYLGKQRTLTIKSLFVVFI